MRTSSSDYYRPAGPRDPAVETRLEQFRRVNAFVMARGGWVTSLPGAAEVRIECLPGSIVPSDLRAIGYDLCDDGEGERILPSAIVQRFTCNAAGEFEPMAGGSTRPVALTQRHAGICKVVRYICAVSSDDCYRQMTSQATCA
jgi:hypothetical protein